MDDLIYLDNNATTLIDPRVLEAMLPYMKGLYGNAASSHHFGQKIKKAVQQARENVAEFLNAEPKEIVFTSGATEAINLAIKGVALHPTNSKKHLITTQTEHKAVLDTCHYLETVGFQVSYLPVQGDGILDVQVLENAIKDDTFLICVMLVNNETGVIQDLERISSIAKSKAIKTFSDATQAVGKIKVDVLDLGIDLLTLSAHKFHGPKGIGCLYINSDCRVIPSIHGGGQEQGFRSGTLNVAGIVGLAAACQIVNNEFVQIASYVGEMRDSLETSLLQFPRAFTNGNIQQRVYNTTNICFPGLGANLFIDQHKRLAVSTGSACTSSLVQPSHVLSAMMLSQEDALASIRFSLSKFNTKSEIALTLQQFQTFQYSSKKL